ISAPRTVGHCTRRSTIGSSGRLVQWLSSSQPISNEASRTSCCGFSISHPCRASTCSPARSSPLSEQLYEPAAARARVLQHERSQALRRRRRLERLERLADWEWLPSVGESGRSDVRGVQSDGV